MASGFYPLNGKIYLNGGFATAFIDSVSSQTWEYDPVADTFTDKAPSPQVQGGTASGIVNGHLLMAGGRTNPDMTLDLTWDYDIATNTWSQRQSLPSPKNVSGGAVAQGLLFSIGGGNPFAPFTTTDVVSFDSGSNTWSPQPPLNAQRSFAGTAAAGNTLVAAGGRDGATTSLSSVETLQLAGPPPGCPAGSAEVSIGDNFFDPANASVPVGTTVCWTNNGQVTHTATSNTGVFDSGFMSPGDSFSFTFNSAGSYAYHCTIHGA